MGKKIAPYYVVKKGGSSEPLIGKYSTSPILVDLRWIAEIKNTNKLVREISKQGARIA